MVKEIELTVGEKNKISELTEELVKNCKSDSVNEELFNRLCNFVAGVKLGLIDNSTKLTF